MELLFEERGVVTVIARDNSYNSYNFFGKLSKK